MSQQSAVRVLPRLLVWLFLLLSVVLIAQLVVWSVSFRWYFPSVLPESVSLRAWRLIVDTESTMRSIVVSLFLSLTVTAVNVAIGLPAALGIHRLRRWAQLCANICVLLPLLVPPLSVIIGGYQGLVRLGLTDSIVGVMIVHLLPTLPYMIIITQAALSNIDLNYLSVARALGASGAQAYARVFLPLMFPGLIVGAFFVFLISWSQYLPTLIVGGGRVVTIPLSLFSYAAAGDLSLMAVYSMLLVLPPLALLFVNARYVTGQAYYARVEREKGRAGYSFE